MTGGILFDMDGTLIESEPIWIAEEARLAADLGIPWTTEDAAKTVGGPLDEFANIFIERGAQIGHHELIATLSDRVTAHILGGPPWLPGAYELLQSIAAAGIPAAIVTNSMRRTVEPVLAAAPDGALRLAVTFDDVERSKPDAEPYLTGATGLGIPREHAIVFEDSITGATAARAAGMPIWFVETHMSAPQWADRAIKDLSEVTVDELRAALAALVERAPNRPSTQQA